MVSIRSEFLTGMMLKIAEASFNATNNFGVGLLPAAITRKILQPGQVVLPRKLAQDHIGNRRRRFADGKARVLSFFYQAYTETQAM